MKLVERYEGNVPFEYPNWIRGAEIVEIWEEHGALIALMDDDGSSEDGQPSPWRAAVNVGTGWVSLDAGPDESAVFDERVEAQGVAVLVIEDALETRVPPDAWPNWKSDEDVLARQLQRFKASFPTNWEYVTLFAQNDPNGSYEYLLLAPESDVRSVFDEVFEEVVGVSSNPGDEIQQLSTDILAALPVLMDDLRAMGAWGYLAPYVRNIEHYMKLIRRGDATVEDVDELAGAAADLSEALESDYGAAADFDVPNVEAEAISIAHEIANFSAQLQILAA